MTTPLRFRRLDLRVLDGLGRAGVKLTDLGDGINVVIGPNASGKTRTTSGMRWLLWPALARREKAMLAATFELGGHEWIVDLKHGDASYTCDQAQADPPTLPSTDVAGRYTLGLHEMLSADSRPLAETIVRESAGGYDPAAAASSLKFRKAASKPKNEPAAVRDRRKAYQVARDEQAGIQRDESTLEDLRRELTAARAASARLEVLGLVAERAERLAVAGQARTRLDAFSTALERVTGNEQEQLAALERKLERARADHVKAGAEKDDANQAREACALPDTGLAPDLVGTLRAELDALRAADEAVARHETELAAARAERDASREQLGDAVTDEQLHEIDAEHVVDLANFAERFEAANADQIAVDQEIAQLRDGGAGEEPATVDPDQLKAARRTLLSWLQTSEGSPGVGLAPRVLLVLATLAILILAILLAALVTLPLIAVLAVALLPGLALLLLPSSSQGDRATHVREYGKLGVEPPGRWTVPEVTARVDALQREIDAAVTAAERQRQAAGLERRAADVRARLDELEQERQALARKFGVAPESAVARDSRTLAWLVRHLLSCHQAAAKVAAARAALDRASRTRGEVIARIDAGLTGLDYDPVESLAQARARVEDLARREAEHDRATDRLAATRKEMARLEEEAGQLDTEIAAVFGSLELDPGDRVGLERLCDEHADFAAASTVWREEDQRARDAEDRLRSHALFEESLLSLEPGDVEAERDRASDEAGRVEEIQERITEIRTRVKQAREAHDVAKTLAKLREAEDTLAERREVDQRAVVGHVVSQWLTGETRESTLPPVFRRAAQLFAEITKHRYALKVTEGKTPSFLAFDNNQERLFELDQLSSGTRTQLLLAVRMAFVERSEEGVKLPLVLDETLAISDDQRAAAIVEAVLKLCADGRQAFYFTAQQDEVDKWARALKEKGVDGRFVDLAAGRVLADVEVFGGIAEVDKKVVLPPGDMDYEEYGRALGVPGIDLYEPLGEVHVWYLLDDAELLWRLLGMGIERKGQLERLLKVGGEGVVGMGEQAARRVQVSLRMLETLHSLWSTGRGSRIDRAALMDCKAVGPKFLDDVASIAEQQQGDVKRFLEALAGAEIRRFGAAKLATCRERLLDAGLLDEGQRRPTEEIRIGMLNAIGPVTDADRLVAERLLCNVPG